MSTMQMTMADRLVSLQDFLFFFHGGDAPPPPAFTKPRPGGTAPAGKPAGPGPQGSRWKYIAAGAAVLVLIAAIGAGVLLTDAGGFLNGNVTKYLDKMSTVNRTATFQTLGADVNREEKVRFAIAYDDLCSDARVRNYSYQEFRSSQHRRLMEEVDSMRLGGINLSESQLWIARVEQTTGRDIPDNPIERLRSMGYQDNDDDDWYYDNYDYSSFFNGSGPDIDVPFVDEDGDEPDALIKRDGSLEGVTMPNDRHSRRSRSYDPYDPYDYDYNDYNRYDDYDDYEQQEWYCDSNGCYRIR